MSAALWGNVGREEGLTLLTVMRSGDETSEFLPPLVVVTARVDERRQVE